MLLSPTPKANERLHDMNVVYGLLIIFFAVVALLISVYLLKKEIKNKCSDRFVSVQNTKIIHTDKEI